MEGWVYEGVPKQDGNNEGLKLRRTVPGDWLRRIHDMERGTETSQSHAQEMEIKLEGMSRSTMAQILAGMVILMGPGSRPGKSVLG